MLCPDSAGQGRNPDKHRIRFTATAWDRLEVADLDEPAFVYTAVCLDTREWHLHHAIRAVIESRAIRLT
jgi:hypothetical protein